MANSEDSKLGFFREGSHDLMQRLRLISNKSEIGKLEIVECHILRLNEVLNGFGNLIDLTLSNCAIQTLESGFFDNLLNLKLLNLSNNAIKSIHSSVFILNFNLQTVILNNNLLDDIQTAVFSTTENLEILNLSYNNISALGFLNVYCGNLKELHLNSNRISELYSQHFCFLTELTCLNLSTNRIQALRADVFKNLIQLRYLNLDENLIRHVDFGCFRKLINLNTFYLGNDYDIERRDVFENCKNLVFLKLTISKWYGLRTISTLKSLTHLDLTFNQREFNWTSKFSKMILDFKSLHSLKLVFHKISLIHLCNFSELTSLAHLHIECMEPVDCVKKLYFYRILPNSPKLEHLALVMLNNFTVDYLSTDFRCLKHLNLSGLKNFKFPISYSNCALLEYLNLSFSEISSVSECPFENFVNLKVLELQHSKLKSLESGVLRNNRQLEYFNCCHCCITKIGVGVFSNLVDLIEVNISRNPLAISPDRSVYGLIETCRFISDS